MPESLMAFFAASVAKSEEFNFSDTYFLSFIPVIETNLSIISELEFSKDDPFLSKN